MSDCENRPLKIRKVIKSTQSFEEMFDEIVYDAVRTDIGSVSCELLDRSSNCNYESDDRNRTEKQTDIFITKIRQNADMLNSTLNSDIEENDCNHTPDYGQYQINSENKNLDGYSSTQESLCTECRFDNSLNSLFSSLNDTQRQTQSGCYPMARNQIVETRDGDRCEGKRFLQKRSLSVTPERRYSAQRCLKKFKSEGSVSTVKNGDNNICEIIKRVIITREISMKNILNIDQTIIPFAKVCNDTPPPENILTNNKTDRGSPNKVVASQSQNVDKTDSNYSYSPLSQSTIEEIYYIDDANGVEHSQTNESVKEMQETHSLECTNFMFNQSTIGKVYCTDTADDISYAPDVNSTYGMPECQTAEENSVRGIINEEIIQGEEIMVRTIIDSGLEPPNDSLPDEMKTRENKPMNLVCKKDLERECSVNNTRAEGDVESQCLTETQLKKIEPKDKRKAKDIVSVYLLDDSLRDVDSAKDSEFRNEGVLKLPDDSVLEISMDSESEQLIRKDTIDERGKIGSVHAVDNVNTNSRNSKIISENKRGARNGPIDLTTVITNNSPAENAVPLKDVSIENVETKIALDDFDTQFLTETQSDAIERQVEIVTREISFVNSTPDPAAHGASIKASNISSRDVKNFRDDLSLEFLSESELQRIEEEAYNMKAKETSAVNLKNIKAKSVPNEQDVFYRPERLNEEKERGNDDLTLPNWVTNPAPEPNYDKMKCAIQMRRGYIKKMLDEILRLSTIIAKVRGIVYAEHRYSDSEVAVKSSSQIQDSQPIHHTENNPNNRCVASGASGHAVINSNPCGNLVTTNLVDDDIFYVPQSSTSKYNARSNIAIAIASANAVTIKDPNANGKFYAPGLKRSKSDAPLIFNRLGEVEVRRDKISSSYTQSNVSNMFGSLKRDFNGNRTCEPDISRISYSGRESETKNKEKLANLISAEYQLLKTSSNVTISVKNKSVSNVNKVEPLDNDTIFYSPDKLSSASSNCQSLLGVKNSQIPSSSNFTNRAASTDAKLYEHRPVNFGKNLSPQAISNDDSIFYNGNKTKGVNFKML